MSTALKKLEEPQVSPTRGKLPFWERVVEIGKQVPDSEWKNVPTDASTELDHYLYGAAKKY